MRNQAKYEYQKKWNAENRDKVLASKRKYSAEDKNQPKRSHCEWTSREIEEVLAHDIPDRELARKLNRTIQSIQMKRWRLKQSQLV